MKIPEKPVPTKYIATYSSPNIEHKPVDEDLTKQLAIPKKNETTRSIKKPSD